MSQNLKKIEKLINSELSSKIQSSLIENEELLIFINENNLIDVIQFLKSNEKSLMIRSSVTAFDTTLDFTNWGGVVS